MSHVLSKILWLLVQPGNLLFFLLVLGLVLLVRRRVRLAAWIIGGVLGLMTVLAVLPLGKWLVAPLEDRFPMARNLPERIDGIVLLGGFVDPELSRRRDQVALGGSADRLTAFLELARRHPQAKLVFSGGAGSPLYPDAKEAATVRRLLGEIGFPTDQVIFEDRSRNTFENAVFSKELAKPQANEQWLLVTSAFHMPRAVGCFRKAGWTVIAHPVDYQTDGQGDWSPRFDVGGGLVSILGPVHEWLGLFSYFQMGRTDALFPAP
jgi:uncharacterized SAM-binding protein YcdF (DUF218 family)